jgi:hypothetical protein
MYPITISSWCVLLPTTGVPHYRQQLMRPITINNWWAPLPLAADAPYYHQQLVCPITISSWCVLLPLTADVLISSTAGVPLPSTAGVPLPSPADVSHYHKQPVSHYHLQLIWFFTINSWCTPLQLTCLTQFQSPLKIADLRNCVLQKRQKSNGEKAFHYLRILWIVNVLCEVLMARTTLILADWNTR